jgi:hypothetical protein
MNANRGVSSLAGEQRSPAVPKNGEVIDCTLRANEQPVRSGFTVEERSNWPCSWRAPGLVCWTRASPRTCSRCAPPACAPGWARPPARGHRPSEQGGGGCERCRSADVVRGRPVLM